jgi:hypothetical protein
MEAKLATEKYCKVLRGSIEAPRLDVAGDKTAWPDHLKVCEGELVTLEADLADRLAALKIVEILP